MSEISGKTFAKLAGTALGPAGTLLVNGTLLLDIASNVKTLFGEGDGQYFNEVNKRLDTINKTLTVNFGAWNKKAGLPSPEQLGHINDATNLLNAEKEKAEKYGASGGVAEQSIANSYIETIDPVLEKLSESTTDALHPILRSVEDLATGAKNAESVLTDLGVSLAGNLFLPPELSQSSQSSQSVPSLGSFFWGAVKESAFSLFSGNHASGGPVGVGRAYMVGENGPELFMSGTPGNIIPNHALGGGGSSPVNIQVINNAPVQVSASEEQNARGGRDIKLVIDEVVAGALSRPGSRTRRALEVNYGARQQLVGR